MAFWEQSACTQVCTGRPATFPSALEWTWHRLIWRDPPGLHAVTIEARTARVMIGALLPVTILMAIASAGHYFRYRRGLRKDYEAMVGESFGRERVLLVVATDVERKAVLERAPGSVDFSAGHPVHRLGVLGGVEVLLAQVGPGITSPISAAYSVPELIDEWHTRYVILLGICYGLREESQSLGDVIIGRRLRVINLRVGADEDRDRGDVITAGHRLERAFQVVEAPSGFRVWTGELISWDVLVDLPALRDALKVRYRDALGGEMEGAAVYAASVRAGTDWIVVKGICDWGRDKNDTMQRRAAANAATLVLDLIEAGAFAYRR